MSLCCLKTRDLSWQDHSINIELILAPRKTNLLSKQHISLGSKCEDEVTRYELKQNTFLKHLQLEKHHLGQKATDYYILKAKRFLDNFPVDLRKEILNRRSFSDALNKIRDEVLENQKRAHSEPLPNRSGSYRKKSDTNDTKFPQLSSQFKKKIPDSKRGDFTYITEVPERNNELPPVIIEVDKTRPEKPSLRRSNTEYISMRRTESGKSNSHSASSDSRRPKLTRQKSVRFENDNEPSEKKATLQEKVKEFIKEQEYFNSQVQHNHQVNKTGNENENDKEKLVSAFDNFCKMQNNKSQLHKLVKLASKFKVSNSSMTNSVRQYKSSRSYQTIHNVS
ncbi:uncharacterized protein LOC143062810 [Mytilus galloprovincialis]|uniref:uncharacterized protein LOC143062810 n=1 Tax=Mytilus galloprovincialis TaxID=29158 RepID=UPI003F7B5903